MVQPQFTISTEKTDSPNFGRFVIEPLPQGYGTTLGNALRRVLYTSIPGAAITSVYIPGVNHQFTTIDGAREDVVQMVLALKQLRPAYAGDKPAKITLSVKGPGVITAGQFETPPDVKISNPELVIANLTDKNTKLEMEATVESGFGYSPAEERKSSTLGVIPTDASFTPVIRVNYEIQDTRVGRVTNFDKLIMEILTDGTITPQSPSNAAGLPSAFHQAAGSNIAIEELDLPTRIANALQKAGFESVADLLSVPRTDLAKVKNLGGKSVKIIEAALSERGFELS